MEIGQSGQRGEKTEGTYSVFRGDELIRARCGNPSEAEKTAELDAKERPSGTEYRIVNHLSGAFRLGLSSRTLQKVEWLGRWEPLDARP
jgi:hypothetical protein